jgi:Ca-activated chloride channel family protein
MKRNLNHKQYELSANERESLWHAIRRETHGPRGGRNPRRGFRPALAVTAVAATLTLMTAWYFNVRNLTGYGAGRPDVAMLELNETIQTRPLGKSAERARDERALRRPEEPVSIVETPRTGSPSKERVAEPKAAAVPPVADGELDADDGSAYRAEVRDAVTETEVQPKSADKYAVDAVEEALTNQAGTVMRSGDVYVRGGRSGEVEMSVEGVDQDNRTWGTAKRMVAPVPTVPDAGPGSVTGGTTAPNGEQVELMYFESAGVNPFVATEDDALSTFAVDVDNASWTLTRNYLDRGMLPPRDAIRVEEFINAFDAGWERHTDRPFRIHTEGARSRFGAGYHLLRVGLVGQDLDDEARKPANLIFVIDVSGSMDREARLGTVKQALHMLLDELGEGDRVGIVVYGSRGEVQLPLTDVSQRAKIAAAIDRLRSGGSTNAAEGLDLAYRMARENYDAGIINRLILCSDGVANTGVSTEAGGILDVVRQASDEGITLSTIGFGMGNYNDVLMEKLANQGDGNYYYVDKLEEAERVFGENLTSLLQTIAREVKVQVEFDELYVQRWRLLGYENRDIADQDFRNDQVDAGEVGVGHQVTALYELKLVLPDDGRATTLREKRRAAADHKVGTVRLRYEAPSHDRARAGQVTEIAEPILLSQFAGDYAEGTSGMRVQTVVAEFAEILRGSYWAKGHSLADLVPVADALAEDLDDDAQVQELARMIRQAANLAVDTDK